MYERLFQRKKNIKGIMLLKKFSIIWLMLSKDLRMIPLCGIALALGIVIIYFVWEQRQFPTQHDEDELNNKLIRMALDKNNRKEP